MNSSELISALKIHGSWPTSNDLFSDPDFLVLFNHQMRVEIIPMMQKLNEEYFLHYKDFEISSGASYRIPKRAIGSKLRDLKIIDSSGNYQGLTRLFEEDRVSNPSGYYITRNSVELSGGYSSGTLRMSFFARPGTLVLTTACAQVQSIDAATNSVVVNAVPSTFSTGSLVDIVQNDNPYDLLSIDTTITGISGTTINFASLPSDLVVNDWICRATESPVPQVPEELHPVLIQSSLCKTLSAKKDKAYRDELDTLIRIKEDVINMLDPRVENSSNKVRSGKLIGYFSSRRYSR